MIAIDWKRPLVSTSFGALVVREKESDVTAVEANLFVKKEQGSTIFKLLLVTLVCVQRRTVN